MRPCILISTIYIMESAIFNSAATNLLHIPFYGNSQFFIGLSEEQRNFRPIFQLDNSRLLADRKRFPDRFEGGERVQNVIACKRLVL